MLSAAAEDLGKLKTGKGIDRVRVDQRSGGIQRRLLVLARLRIDQCDQGPNLYAFGEVGTGIDHLSGCSELSRIEQGRALVAQRHEPPFLLGIISRTVNRERALDERIRVRNRTHEMKVGWIAPKPPDQRCGGIRHVAWDVAHKRDVTGNTL